MKTNYKDLMGIKNGNNVIAYIPYLYNLQSSSSLYVYQILSDNQAVCGYENGPREIYDIAKIDGKDWLCLKDDKNIIRVASLDDLESMYDIIGYIEDDKIYPEYGRQGYYYKNALVYIKTKDLSKEELDKLPLKEKICYIPEGTFDENEYIEINDNLKAGHDYYTVYDIREDINNYYGENIMKQIDEPTIMQMIENVFYCVDWQHPSSLLDADQYLDGYIEELGISLNDDYER